MYNQLSFSKYSQILNFLGKEEGEQIFLYPEEFYLDNKHLISGVNHRYKIEVFNKSLYWETIFTNIYFVTDINNSDLNSFLIYEHLKINQCTILFTDIKEENEIIITHINQIKLNSV